jgi:hypothetical protein
MVTPTFSWQAGDHWCSTGRDDAGNVVKPIGRGATKEAAEDELLRLCGEEVPAPRQAPPESPGPIQTALAVG